MNLSEKYTKNVDVTGNCEWHGDWITRTLEAFRDRAACPTCLKDRSERARIESIRDEKILARSRKIAASGVPSLFVDSTLQNYSAETPRQSQILATCQRYVELTPSDKDFGRSMVMTGRTGNGKTHLACAMVLHHRLENGVMAIYSDFTTMIRRLKATFQKDAKETETKVIKSYSEAEFLVIDEVGVQLNTDFERLVFQDIIDRRYRERLPTVVISNLPYGELSKVVGERVLDRLRSNSGAILVFDWKSHRSAA